MRVKDIPRGDAAQRDWEILTGYTGPIPDECTLVDGGLISNFPIDVFHRMRKEPLHPTFGVKLAPFRGANPPIEHLTDLVTACFRAASHARDDDVILHNPHFKALVAVIDTDGFNWLDFQEVRAHLAKAARAAW